jgi:hypothetical protein
MAVPAAQIYLRTATVLTFKMRALFLPIETPQTPYKTISNDLRPDERVFVK